MNKLEFEALKQKYPNRLRCFVMGISPSVHLVYDTETKTRTTFANFKIWTVDVIDEQLSWNNELPIIEAGFRHNLADVEEDPAWEEL